MNSHPYGWLSVMPPLVAIALAIATRRVVVSLLAGIFAGGLILSHGHPGWAVVTVLRDHLWETLTDENKLHVFAFTVLMGVMVGIINRAGGMRGMVRVIAPWARSRRGGQLTTWGLGLFIFFDDYANTLLLGSTLRPLTDRLRISREKLAYLVDSTAAPVSGLAIVSTWVAGEIGYIQDGLDKLPGELHWSAMGLFIASIPFRFYVLWALALVPLIALLGRDFGPMWEAERRALAQGVEGPCESAGEGTVDVEPGVPERWYNAVIPIGVTVGVILYLMYRSGWASLGFDPSARWMDIFGNADSYGSLLWGALAGAVCAALLASAQRLLSHAAIGEAAAAGALLMCPALAILWLASALSAMTGNKPLRRVAAEQELTEAVAVARAEALAEQGADVERIAESLLAPNRSQVVTAGLAKVLRHPVDVPALARAMRRSGAAWSTIEQWFHRAGADDASVAQIRSLSSGSAVEDAPAARSWSPSSYGQARYRLYTGEYLSGLLEQRLSPLLLPTLVFILSAAIAFATGTSWGTMGIVMPLVIPLAYRMLVVHSGAPGADHPVFVGVIGSVLAGAIFGDHCSPISDTTILSSQASGCPHIAHVATQMPYALLVAGIAIVIGTLPSSWGVSPWLLFPIGVAAMVVWLWWRGRPVE